MATTTKAKQPNALAVRNDSFRNRASSAMVRAATQQTAMANREVQRMQNQTQQAEQQIERYKKFIKGSKLTKIGVDFGGGAIALVSTELINWGFRAAKDAAGEESWWGRNSDLLQSLPHVVLGTLVYLGELLTRPNHDKPVTVRRQVVSEAAKLFQMFGMYNLVRAARLRMGDSKRTAAEAGQLSVEVAALRAENEKLRGMAKSVTATSAGG